MTRLAPRLLTLLCLCASSSLRAQEMVCPQLGADALAELPRASDDERVILKADQADITADGLSTLAGTVRLTQGAKRIESQALSYDRQNQKVRLTAESLFASPQLVVRSQKAEFDLADQTGVFEGTEFTLVPRAARGAADRVELSSDGTVQIDEVYYTTCAPGSRAWFLEASEIDLDREEGLGRAYNARLRFGYVPVLYSPYFQFPIDDRRRTGLLFPTFGESDNTGFDLRQPLYLNLAPNYDAQITPRYMSRRGTQVGTEGRYLLRNHLGQASYTYLDEDSLTGTPRFETEFHHQGLLNRRLAMEARYGEVSDPQYFEDLGERLEAASITHLDRSLQLTYASPAAYTVMARVTDFQTVASTVVAADEPYQRLPEIRIDAITRKEKWGLRAGITGQYANFVRSTSPEGQRLDVDPFLRFQHDRSAWFVASQADLRHTRYVTTDNTSSPDNTPTRTLPQFSLEGGLRFERVTGGGNLQTLEPRAYYLYVPYRDQSSLPQFDSGEPDFDFVELFARNRFTGEDRLSDANHLTLAFTSRLIDPVEGEQRLSGSIGQIYRFAPTRVFLNTCNPAIDACTVDSGGTDLIGEVDYRPFTGWNATTTGQWSQDRNAFVRGSAALRWHEGRRRAGLVYRYRESISVPATYAASETIPLEQYDLSAASPVYGPFSLLGRWRVDREDRRTLEALGGIEYDTCCWALRGAYRRYQFNSEQEYTTGIYFQVELKGLTRLGAGFQSLLPALD